MTHKSYIYLITAVILAAMLSGCSTQKNTASTRSYHQMCTRYNVGFNAKNAYIEGQKAINTGNVDNFTERLNMFPISNEKNANTASSQMERTIEKCRKAIKKHSITKKPKRRSDKMKDPKYVYFYNQEEYVQGVKDAWILLGKAELHKGDFIGASATFAYIQRHYPSDLEIVCEARIWQARAYGEMGWQYEAREVFDKINENDVTRRLNKDYAQTKAFLLLKESNTAEVIPYLQLATDKERNKFFSSRFNYILGQLYTEQGKTERATEHFKTAARQAQAYPLEFNAKLMMLQSDTKAWKTSIKKLKKMAKNSNNKDYKDQIFTVIGNIQIAHADTVAAIEAYKTAIAESTRGGEEKAAVLITLADLYYNRNNYLDAHPCYQEASGILSATHPDYKRVSRLGETLGELAQNYNTIVLQDSLQHLATLSAEEQLAVVEKIIEKVKQDEAEAERLAKEAEEKGFVESSRLDMGAAQIGGNADWYFYNQRLKTAGATQFRQKWGNRTLEDNWRRLNKTASLFSETDESESEDDDTETDDTSDNGEADDTPAHHKPDYYLSQIPKTEEQIAASEALVANAMYTMAGLYDEKLADYSSALGTYQDFQQRFAQDKRQLEGLYASYRLCGKLNNTEEQEIYRNRIISEYPDSKYAAMLSQPDYIERMAKMLEMQDSLYNATYSAYTGGRLNTVVANYDYMQANYPLSSLMPKFAFLRALAIGKTTPDEPFREALTELIEKYPNADVTSMCKDILALMGQGLEAQAGSTGSLAAKREEAAEIIDEPADTATHEFTNEPKSPHMLLLVVRKDADLNANELLYDVAAFNFTKFMIKDYDLTKRETNGRESIIISSLESYQEAEWYEKMLLAEPSLQGRVTLDKVERIIISDDNYDLLTKGKTLDNYRLWLETQNTPTPPTAKSKPKKKH